MLKALTSFSIFLWVLISLLLWAEKQLIFIAALFKSFSDNCPVTQSLRITRLSSGSHWCLLLKLGTLESLSSPGLQSWTHSKSWPQSPHLSRGESRVTERVVVIMFFLPYYLDVSGPLKLLKKGIQKKAPGSWKGANKVSSLILGLCFLGRTWGVVYTGGRDINERWWDLWN